MQMTNTVVFCHPGNVLVSSTHRENKSLLIITICDHLYVHEVHLQNAWVQLKMSNMVVCLWCSYWTGSALSAWRCFCEQIGKERDDINWWCRWSKLTVSLKVTCSIQRITYTPGSRPGNLKVEYCPSLYGINNGLYLPLLCRGGGSLRLVLRTTGLFLDICCHFSAGENHWEHLWYLKGTNA